jgi:hypothetical protein
MGISKGNLSSDHIVKISPLKPPIIDMVDSIRSY